MGSLHAGHLSLIKKSLEFCDRTIVSIYVNPEQFGPDEDLETYPRSIKSDIDLLEELGTDALFLPTNKMMYPDTFSTYITENVISNFFEGVSRPQFFRGVLTIVLKLFNIINPNKVFFGMKDYQQLVLVDKMISDFNLDLEIIRCETIRENSGLAMSSRNRYLSENEINQLGKINASLENAKNQITDSIYDPVKIKNTFLKNISTINDISVDYFEIVDMQCKHIEVVIVPCVILVAVIYKDIRLIDNIVIK